MDRYGSGRTGWSGVGLKVLPVKGSSDVTHHSLWRHVGDDVLVEPVDRVHNVARVGRAGVDHLLDHLPVTVGVRRRHVDERLGRRGQTQGQTQHSSDRVRHGTGSDTVQVTQGQTRHRSHRVRHSTGHTGSDTAQVTKGQTQHWGRGVARVHSAQDWVASLPLSAPPSRH